MTSCNTIIQDFEAFRAVEGQLPESPPRSQRIGRRERLGIINTAIQLRLLLLRAVRSAGSRRAAASDFGWLFTLGGGPLGILLAVGAGEEARRCEALARTLEWEALQLEILKTRL